MEGDVEDGELSDSDADMPGAGSPGDLQQVRKGTGRRRGPGFSRSRAAPGGGPRKAQPGEGRRALPPPPPAVVARARLASGRRWTGPLGSGEGGAGAAVRPGRLGQGALPPE